MKLYALLVGINDYPIKPLDNCRKDVEKIQAYLQSLQSPKSDFDQINITPLLDSQATKSAVTDGINEVLGAAGDEDVAFFYFSGHGAQEYTDGRFPTEHDGLLECLVCHYSSEEDSGFLLADKEIRFLLSKLKNEPHLVTVFDCCHSGDMVRAAGSNNKQDQVKRLSGYFDARPYDQFIFNTKIPEALLKTEGLAKVISFKNHVHIAACGPEQSAWEDHEGGVFTRYLLKLLAATKNQVSYQEITRWAKISIKDITSKQQTPTFSIQQSGKVHALSSWLNLSSEPHTKKGHLVFNEQLGWVYTRGAIMGVHPGLKLQIQLTPNQVHTITVKSVTLDNSLIESPFDQGINLDTDKQYEVLSTTTFNTINVFFNNLDQDEATGKEVKSLLSPFPKIRLTEDSAEASYFINLFNEQVYISLPDWAFRPLAEQIDLLELTNEKVAEVLNYQLNYLCKWHHFLSLENPDKGFDIPPLKIEVQIVGTDQWADITNNQLDLMPLPQNDNLLFQKLKIRVTNTSRQALHVAVLSLFSDFEIEASPFDNQSVKIEPGQSKELYDHLADSTAYISLEPYMDVYNWPWEFWNFTFIVNNFEDFTTSISDFLQPEVNHPFTISPSTKDISAFRGGGPAQELKEVEKTWGTVKATLRLKNTTYNIITGDLKKLWQEYTEDERLAPFIGQLYIEQFQKGFYQDSYSKPNAIGLDENEKNLGFKIKLFLGNKLDGLRRLRKFKKAKRRMPDRPVIIAEGDSWFLYPFLVKDILDYVMEHFPVRSLAAGGDELQNYKRSGQLLRKIPKIRPSYVLISGGGNDVVGEEIQYLLHKNIPPDQPAKDYLNDKFQEALDELEALYLYFFEEIAKFDYVKQIFVHGYDFILASDDEEILKKGWVNRYMKEKGINSLEDRQNVINYIINAFNKVLERICTPNPLVTYINARNQVESWYDEIHPDDHSFGKVSRLFINAINNQFEGDSGRFA